MISGEMSGAVLIGIKAGLALLGFVIAIVAALCLLWLLASIVGAVIRIGRGGEDE